MTPEEERILGMKSHDCHLFVQDLLLPAFQGIVDGEILESLVELSKYFKQLCYNTLTMDVLEQMVKSITITLCKVDHIFVLAFFNVVVHLDVHMVTKARLVGPI